MRFHGFAAALLLTATSSLFAASDPTYTALREARLDGRTIAVAGYAFDRDVFHVTLNGTLYLLAAVNGATAGGVFVGDGEYTLTPAIDAERRQLAIQTGDDKLTTLTDKFDSAVFFDSALVKAAGEAKAGVVNDNAARVFDDFLKREKKNFTTNFHIRVLQDVLDSSDVPLFFAMIRGKKYPPAVLAVDPRGADALRLFDIGDGGEGTLLYIDDATKGGIWYLAHLKREYATGHASVLAHVADADRYQIDTTIAGNGEISGTTLMSFTCRQAARVMPLALARKLRIDDVQLSPAEGEPKWTSVPFIQEKAEEDADAAVVFPTPLKADAKYLLKTTYHGVGKEVLRDAGDGNFTVGARDSWYPNVGSFRDTADFELTFRLPAKSKNQVVAVGTEVSNEIKGDQRIAVWKSTHPLRVAGFNYGNFKKTSQLDKDSGMTVEVYANPGEPDILRRINEVVASAGPEDDFYFGAGASIRIDTTSLAQAAFADGANTSRVGNVYFGPLADKRIAITQQSAWYYGQSWPTLVYLPYLAFVGSTARNMLGFGMDMAEFVDQVGAHEVAHQWWGHQVGSRSYRDQWLSEGFAEFTSGLVLQVRKGTGATNGFYEKKRKNILERQRAARMSSDKAGPITQGVRLSTWQDPPAYQIIVYDKGAYVLHMLRMLMADPKKQNPDEDFMAMMKDFASTYAGRNASTDDFQRMVEKHAPPKLKITTDGKLNWFFDEWVRGTDIPRYVSKLEAKATSGGKYRISGTITQSEVTDNFAAIVPIYLTFDKGAAKLGEILVVGNSSKNIDVEVPLPREPKAVAVNAMHDILAR
jgi:peptidase M1-like protein